MKNFEQLLLKTGHPDLIVSYCDDYADVMSDDFLKAVAEYGKMSKQKISRVLDEQDDILDMNIYRFLERYGTNNIMRISSLMYANDIKTVRELLELNKRVLLRTKYYGGPKILSDLSETLEKFGLRLED